ncbi:MAG: Hsp70 family protein [Merismopedia sp. SIO2A8]|nr:Hsp70 family protein [Symploca sp. SIO2B6]NET48346.1 Hsp70 family protein [Merismopedia sp. SIO2A8]
MGESSSYAIDFGTSNTVITRWNAVTQAPETVSLPQWSWRLGDNPPLIPSLLYVENAATEDVLVGQLVRDRGLDVVQNARFFRNFKRGIGTPVQGFVPELDGRTMSFEQIGQWFLNQLIQTLQDTNGSLDSLVFTVPVDSFEAYRNWLGQTCQSLDINQVRMLDEPTAAALGYGLAEGELLLVMDFGGGTLDFSLVRREVSRVEGQQATTQPLGFILKWGQRNMAENSAQRPQTARVLAKAGQNLGGSDLDQWILHDFVKTQGIPTSPLTLRLAERLKIKLSQDTTATEVYFNDETFESYELTLDRDRFQAILTDNQLFERLDDSLTAVLRQARQQGIEIPDIDAVLLVGGTAQIPAIQDWLHAYFSAERIKSERPFEAIAQGALQLNQGIEISDFLYHSYGIRYWNRRTKRHDWHPIIRSGQPYPMDNPFELLLGASVDNQPSIELVIGELGDGATSTEVYFDGDQLIMKTVDSSQGNVQPLNDRDGARNLATLSPPGHPGTDRVKLLFQVDRDRYLRVTVEDLLTNEILQDNRIVVQLT